MCGCPRSAQRIDRLCPLAHQEVARPKQHEATGVIRRLQPYVPLARGFDLGEMVTAGPPSSRQAQKDGHRKYH